MNTEPPTIHDNDREYPATAVDAIGGEPVAVIAGDAHVKLYTWHGVTPPYTFDNAQVLYVDMGDAYALAECFGAAADCVVGSLIDRRDGIGR
jgi:hypothetical protein